jgi:hypothetical protein
MADHGEVEYATATGNDYAEHESTYRTFVELTEISIATIVAIVIGLALVGVKDAVWLGSLVTFAAVCAGAIGLASDAKWRAPAVVLAVGFLAFALA